MTPPEALSAARCCRVMLPKHSGDSGHTIKGLFLETGAGDYGDDLAAIDDAGRQATGSPLRLHRAQKGTQTYMNSVLLSLALRPNPS